MDAALPALAGTQVTAFLLVLARVGGLFVFAPVFSARFIPARVKLLVAAAVSVALMPAAIGDTTVPTDAATLSVLIVKELFVGLAFAFSLALLTAAVQAGAALLDTLVGFSFGALVDPISSSQSAVLGQFYGIFAAVVFVTIGGDQMMLLGLAQSYDVLGVLDYPSTSAIAANAVDVLEQVFAIGLAVTAPAIIALVVTDAALGLLARSVPQMNVFIVGIPAKILAGVAVIGASLPFVAAHLQSDLEGIVLQSLRALAGG
jgi:flagellar biosynthesis protein FliR